MTAKIVVDPDWNLSAIAAAAGGDVARAWAEETPAGATLYCVPEVAQEALEAAAAAYDHAAELADRARRSRLLELAATDPGMARILEDVIRLLEARGVITLPELPAGARARIEQRRALRAALA